MLKRNSINAQTFDSSHCKLNLALIKSGSRLVV